MYCRKCGKQIDYDAPICKECEAAETFFGNPTASDVSSPIGNRKEGFGKALASTILGAVAYLISVINIDIALEAIEGVNQYGEYYYGPGIALCFFLSFLCTGAVVVSIIFGIKSIKCFASAKKAGRLLPVATLVLGCVGLACSALTLLYLFVDSILILTMFFVV